MNEKPNTPSPSENPAKPTGVALPATEAPKPEANPNLFTIRRKAGVPRIVTVVVIENGHTEPRTFDLQAATFHVDRVTAIAAVESGGFEIAPASRARLKE